MQIKTNREDCVQAHPRGEKRRKIFGKLWTGLDTKILVLNIEVLTSHCKWGGYFRFSFLIPEELKCFLKENKKNIVKDIYSQNMDVLKLPKIYLLTTYQYILRKHSPGKRTEIKLTTRWNAETTGNLASLDCRGLL